MSVRKSIIAFVLSAAIASLIVAFSTYSENDTTPSGGLLSLFALVGGVLGIAILFVERKLDALLPWSSGFILRFAAGLVTQWILGLFFWTVFHAAVMKLQDGVLAKVVILWVLCVLVYEIFYGVLYSYYHYAVWQTERMRNDRWQMELQFESLKQQISPHYLFNCLNTVSALLYRDTHLAEDFIRRMADTFRYVLSNEKSRLVTLREELEFVRAYYFLLQVRFEFALSVDIRVPDELLSTQIPPMTLQLLVENAVKHNQVTRQTPLEVRIHADNSTLRVINNKTGAAPNASGFKVGLSNIRSRYAFFTDQKVIVQDSDSFTVELPILAQA